MTETTKEKEAICLYRLKVLRRTPYNEKRKDLFIHLKSKKCFLGGERGKTFH